MNEQKQKKYLFKVYRKKFNTIVGLLNSVKGLTSVQRTKKKKLCYSHHNKTEKLNTNVMPSLLDFDNQRKKLPWIYEITYYVN